MFDRVFSKDLEDIVETDDIGFDVGIRMIDRITHACLCGEVDHEIEMMFRKQFFQEIPVGNVTFDKGEILMKIFDLFQTVFLQRDIVVIVHIVDTDDADALIGRKKYSAEIGTDEAAASGDQYRFFVQHIPIIHLFF